MSHESVLSSVAGLGAAVPGLSCADVYIAYLPLAHILEVVAETALLSYGCSIGYSNPGTVTDTARAIPKPDPENGVPVVRGDASILRPTLMAGVPTMFERVRAAVLNNVRKKGGVLSSLFKFALKTRLAARNRGSDTPFWNWLFFDRIRTQSLGGRIRLMLSGGGPLAADTEDFITTVFIAPIIQGYGLTETCAAGTINWPDDITGGRVGPPVLCDDIKLVDWADAGYLHSDTNPRGEIYIGSKSIANGYYKQPEKTRESYFEDADGKRWFATGDIGELMPGGVLRIIDRRKDLFKLAHGEYVAPSKIESVMSQSPLVEMSMLHADSTKDSCVAIVFVNRAAVEKALPEMNGCKSYDYT
jgi:long-chain acyl-CoA synthetase